MGKIKICLVDDEVLIVQLLANYFSVQENIEVLATFNDGEEILAYLESSNVHPDVILSDLRMQNKDGLETTQELKHDFPEIKIVIMSSYYKNSFIGYMLKSGVNAFIPKSIPPDQILEAVTSVYNKDHYFLPEQVEILKSQISPKVPQPSKDLEENLTSRELEVLTLICQQLTTQEIADKLFLNKRTVEGHRNNLLMKTGVRNTAGLVIYAVQNKIVDPAELMLV